MSNASNRAHGISRYNRGCRCEVCRGANREKEARRRAKRREMVANGQMPDTVVHGRAAAINWGCKCEICTAAIKESNAATAERVRKGAIEHTRGGIVSGGPCDRCRVEVSKRRKRNNDRSRENASHHGEEWTGPQMEVIARMDISAREAAAMLGRTFNAVVNMRRKLKSDPRKQSLAERS